MSPLSTATFAFILAASKEGLLKGADILLTNQFGVSAQYKTTTNQNPSPSVGQAEIGKRRTRAFLNRMNSRRGAVTSSGATLST